MLVRLHMSKHVMTVDAEDTAVSALRTMRKLSIRHLPVTEDGKMRGMVTERDLLRVLPGFVSEFLDQKNSSIPIRSALITNLISVEPNATIDSAAQILLEHKISGLPVMKAGELVGILTSDDVLRAFVSVFEFDAGIQLTMVHGDGNLSKEGFDPAMICGKLGIHLRHLIHQDVRRGAEVFVLCAEASEEKIEAFKQAAATFGWLPVKSTWAPAPEEPGDQEAA